jgi:hypothetical protein
MPSFAEGWPRNNCILGFVLAFPLELEIVIPLLLPLGLELHKLLFLQLALSDCHLAVTGCLGGGQSTVDSDE